jgi:hypothetical protein
VGKSCSSQVERLPPDVEITGEVDESEISRRPDDDDAQVMHWHDFLPLRS